MITDQDIEKAQKAQERGAMRPMAQIQTAVKFDKTKTNKCSEREWSRAELVWNNTTQSLTIRMRSATGRDNKALYMKSAMTNDTIRERGTTIRGYEVVSS